jgi:Uma2 family endonuclease
MSTAADHWLLRHRIDVDAFHRMAEAGIFAADARVELIQGEMLDMAPIGSPHAGFVNRLTFCLSQAIGNRAVLSVQHPLRLDKYSEPQPDVALLKPRADFYERQHPTPQDVLLVIEVADSSLRYDREIKSPLCAQYGVTEFWLIDVDARQLTCLREPAQGRYSSSVVLTDVAVDLAWLLGKGHA